MPKLSKYSVAHHRVCKWCTEGKVSVSHKSWLPRNNRKAYYNIFAASAELAYGQPSQDAPKNIRDQPSDG